MLTVGPPKVLSLDTLASADLLASCIFYIEHKQRGLLWRRVAQFVTAGDLFRTEED